MFYSFCFTTMWISCKYTHIYPLPFFLTLTECLCCTIVVNNTGNQLQKNKQEKRKEESSFAACKFQVFCGHFLHHCSHCHNLRTTHASEMPAIFWGIIVCWALCSVLYMLCLTYPSLQQPCEGDMMIFPIFLMSKRKKALHTVGVPLYLLNDYMNPNPLNDF